MVSRTSRVSTAEGNPARETKLPVKRRRQSTSGAPATPLSRDRFDDDDSFDASEIAHSIQSGTSPKDSPALHPSTADWSPEPSPEPGAARKEKSAIGSKELRSLSAFQPEKHGDFFSPKPLESKTRFGGDRSQKEKSLSRSNDSPGLGRRVRESKSHGSPSVREPLHKRTRSSDGPRAVAKELRGLGAVDKEIHGSHFEPVILHRKTRSGVNRETSAYSPASSEKPRESPRFRESSLGSPARITRSRNKHSAQSPIATSFTFPKKNQEEELYSSEESSSDSDIRKEVITTARRTKDRPDLVQSREPTPIKESEVAKTIELNSTAPDLEDPEGSLETSGCGPEQAIAEAQETRPAEENKKPETQPIPENFAQTDFAVPDNADFEETPGQSLDETPPVPSTDQRSQPRRGRPPGPRKKARGTHPPPRPNPPPRSTRLLSPPYPTRPAYLPYTWSLYSILQEFQEELPRSSRNRNNS